MKSEGARLCKIRFSPRWPLPLLQTTGLFMSLPSSEAVPPVSDATPPVPPASPPPEDSSQKRPLLQSSSMIDVNAPKEDQEVVEQSAKRARDLSFKPAASEEEGSRRAQVRQVLGEIAGKHAQLVAFMSELCPEKDGDFVREVDFLFSLSFSNAFCAIAKSK